MALLLTLGRNLTECIRKCAFNLCNDTAPESDIFLYADDTRKSAQYKPPSKSHLARSSLATGNNYESEVIII